MNETVRVFLPGRVTNPMNSSHGHWATRARWAKTWREAAWVAFRASRSRHLVGLRDHVHAGGRLTVAFTGHVARRLDTDNLVASLKSVRDGVADFFDTTDSPAAGHSWTYDQVVERDPARRGVRVTVEAR